MKDVKFLPGTGRWQPAGLTEGNLLLKTKPSHIYPSTMLRMVPLPVSGRI